MYIINGMTTKHSRFEIIMKEMSKNIIQPNPAVFNCWFSKKKTPQVTSPICGHRNGDAVSRLLSWQNACLSCGPQSILKVKGWFVWNWRDPGLRLLLGLWSSCGLHCPFCCLLFLGSRSRILVVERPNFGGQTKIWATLKSNTWFVDNREKNKKNMPKDREGVYRF